MPLTSRSFLKHWPPTQQVWPTSIDSRGNGPKEEIKGSDTVTHIAAGGSRRIVGGSTGIPYTWVAVSMEALLSDLMQVCGSPS
jgi:hypothetical protein